MRTFLASFALALLCAAGAAQAGTGYYLVTVYEQEGERAVDFRFWSVHTASGATISSPELGVSWSPTREWYANVRAIGLHTSFSGNQFLGIGLQNDFLLTHGQYPFDLAIHTDLTHFRDGANGNEIEFGPVLQTEYGRTQINANVLFSRSYSVPQPEPLEMQYQWQARYRFSQAAQFGLQGFGELGKWNDWDPQRLQSHRIGPVFAGEAPAGKHAWKYEFAYFIGKVRASPAKTFSMRIQATF
ncbi:hypothetical protein [Noviherbaspirillum galbum]|uniref:Uncharacterized protein n=1 Tax=Noviherbaspirillum galbum TaxID=2709383 RepID=A0A6B3SW67_9BURK|nr:hypothetical protein [Noviherbaspirillum galbum]NEX64741.1 hypothetical protein [Noviherbaspirillum galbum]